jgi:hypothetical protein
MSKAFSFPSPSQEMPDVWFPRTMARAIDHEDYVRERASQAKYPAAMLAELLDAGEITREQYERLRMERA